MKSTIISKLLFCLTLPFVAFSANAQEFATSQDPIYVVDIMRVLTESIMGKAVNKNLEDEMKKKRVVLEKQKLELDKLKQELTKQSSLLSKEALQSKEEQYLKKQRDFERAYEDQREELALKNKESMEKVVAKMHEAIKSLSDKNNYKIVLERDLRVIVYANSKYDISAEVIKELDNIHVGM